MEREIIEQELNIERENVVISEFPAEDYYTKVEVDDLLDEKANNEDLVPINNSISNIQAEQTTQNTNISANTTNIAQNTANITQNTTDIATINNNLTNYSLKTETGSQIDLSINSSDYKIKAILKDKNGNTIYTSNEIDLPLESVVVNGSYDSLSKEIVLTLQNGNTIRFSVSDLVSGLVSTTTLNTILQDYALNSSIPTNTSDLTNDSGFLNASSFKTINNESIVGSGDITISGLKMYQTSERNTSSTTLRQAFKNVIDDYKNGEQSYVLVLHQYGANPKGLYGIANVSQSGSSTTYTFCPASTSTDKSNNNSNGTTALQKTYVNYNMTIDENDEITSFSTLASNETLSKVLATDVNYTTPYTPLYNGSPATKKYVDDSIASAIGTALSGSY